METTVNTHSVPQSRSIGPFLAAGVLLASSGAAFGKECWLDLYDKANYEGSHVRIEGPAELPSLKSLNGEDWSNRIESLQVGADAEVVAYRQADFQDQPQGPVNHPEAFKSWGAKEIPAYQELEIDFGPGKKAHHLGELDFHRNINSLKLRCRK
jgi:hypothetical protein